MDIYFAPLQGYTQAEYRRLHAEIYGGVDYYYSPFLRVENGEVRRRDVLDIKKDNNIGIKLIPQIIVSNVEELNLTVNAIKTQGYNHIDLNMGCPFPLQTKRGRGAGLLANINRVKDVFKAMADFNDVTFSLKMRTGMIDANDCLKLLPLINELPLKYVVMHPRLGIQQYKGNVDMSVFATFYKECCHPIVYNGDVTTLKDIEQIKNEFPILVGIMIGRGLLSRPSLATEYKTNQILSRDERIELLLKFHDRLFCYYYNKLQGDAHILAKMKTFWDYVTIETVDKKMLKAIKKCISISKYSAIIKMI